MFNDMQLLQLNRIQLIYVYKHKNTLNFTNKPESKLRHCGYAQYNNDLNMYLDHWLFTNNARIMKHKHVTMDIGLQPVSTS